MSPTPAPQGRQPLTPRQWEIIAAAFNVPAKPQYGAIIFEAACFGLVLGVALSSVVVLGWHVGKAVCK